ncbi:uncharacterized protein AB675_9026 [Cyphellophora attinorum]|uniref:BZIP domain-containing protein n=1 Tax=Cyphellophora attinorum TaxID=1664694 RepID=A0A0N1HVP0_9EURO|nr:uncharacterized protein AB675_9026 [Phialophora attinorum]KPI41416.1 hypothetical protein AB675_9026 [Phialophora attinorum]
MIETQTRTKDATTAIKTENGSAPPAKVKKPYVRIMTDKRRAQNRTAQQAFRDRQKKRLEDLDERINATKSSFSKVTAVITPPDDDMRSGEGATGLSDSPYGAPGSDRRNGTPRNADCDQVFQPSGDLPIPYGLEGIVPSVAALAAAESSIATDPFNTPDSMYAPPKRKPIDREEERDEPYSWPMPFRPASDPYNPPPPETDTILALPKAYEPYLSGALSTTTREHAYKYQRRAIASTSSPASRLQQAAYITSTWPLNNILPSTSPSPQSAIQASLAIAAMLKISRTAYLTDAPSSLPTCFLNFMGPVPLDPLFSVTTSFNDIPTAAQSTTRPVATSYAPPNRFYSPALNSTPAKAASAERAMLAHYKADPLISAKFDAHATTVPVALRPRPVQYLRAHPSYLDCIIWPAFRERAVEASVKGTLDHVEFFLDLMHGGVVCWGGQAGGQGWREEVPWNTRSWEAKGWFLRKWRGWPGVRRRRHVVLGSKVARRVYGGVQGIGGEGGSVIFRMTGWWALVWEVMVGKSKRKSIVRKRDNGPSRKCRVLKDHGDMMIWRGRVKSGCR